MEDMGAADILSPERSANTTWSRRSGEQQQKRRWGHCLTLHLSPSWLRVHVSQLHVEYLSAL
jgi:hypothetical protein